MTIRNIIAHVVGGIAAVGAGTWLAIDVRGDGHVELTTAAGAVVLALLAGFLIDKDKTGEFMSFLFSFAGKAKAIKDGRDSNA